MVSRLAVRVTTLGFACATVLGACAVGDGPALDTTLAGDDAGAAPTAVDGGTNLKSDGGSSSFDASAATDTGALPDTGAGDGGVDAGDGGLVVDSGPVDAGPCTKPPPSMVCGTLPQCGCSAGQTCDVTNPTTGAMACLSAGAVPMGGLCTAFGQCAVGLHCWNGTCHAFCGTPGINCTSPPNTTLCFTPDQPAPALPGTPSVNLNLCAVNCDPMNPAAQCGSASCLWFSGSRLSDCRATNNLPYGSPCTFIYDCAGGLLCSPASLACRKWCRIGAAGDCAAPTTCLNIFGVNAPVIGGITLGSCE